MLMGDLSEFPLAEVLGLLATRNNSGVLDVDDDRISGRIELIEGRVRAATTDRGRAGLARRLLGTGAIGFRTLSALVDGDEPALADVALASLLVEGGHVGPGLVAAALREHTIDAIVRLNAMRAGEFRFERVELDPNAPAPVAMAVADLLAGAQDRDIDREAHLDTLGGADAVLLVAVPDTEEVRCSPEAWQVLTLLDGRRSVEDVVRLRGCGPDDTYRRLAELRAVGLVEPLAKGVREPTAELEDADRRLSELEDRWLAKTVPSRQPRTPTGSAEAGERSPAPITNLPQRTDDQRLRPDPMLDDATLNELIDGVEALT